MFNDMVVENLLGTSFGRWYEQQKMIDNRFFISQGLEGFTRRQYILASLELLVEYIPKEANVSSLQYK